MFSTMNSRLVHNHGFTKYDRDSHEIGTFSKLPESFPAECSHFICITLLL